MASAFKLVILASIFLEIPVLPAPLPALHAPILVIATHAT